MIISLDCVARSLALDGAVQSNNSTAFQMGSQIANKQKSPLFYQFTWKVTIIWEICQGWRHSSGHGQVNGGGGMARVRLNAVHSNQLRVPQKQITMIAIISLFPSPDFAVKSIDLIDWWVKLRLTSLRPQKRTRANSRHKGAQPGGRPVLPSFRGLGIRWEEICKRPKRIN